MAVNQIGSTGVDMNAILAMQNARTKGAQEIQKAQQAVEDKQAQSDRNEDKIEKSGTESVTYQKPAQSMSASQLMALEQQRTDSFTKMLEGMVVKQGQQSNLKLLGFDLFVTPEDSAKAAASIAPGGEYSVDAVAGRIMDMAKALAGGDESKISLLRGAVEKGFKAAGVDLGGKLPQISQDTHTEVMKRFDNWEKESKNAGKTSVAEEAE